MGIEEQFRDAKGHRFGMKLRWTQFTRAEYFERMYLLVGVGTAAVDYGGQSRRRVGAAGEARE